MKNTRPRFIVGNVLDVLGDLDDDSIDLVAGSPPYWGLRDYGKGTDAIWGGDGDCVHVHEFVEGDAHLVERHHGEGSKSYSASRWSPKGGEEYDKSVNISTQTKPQAGICHLCGAWKGQLGLEPTWQLYVEHLVQISKEIKRVLKPTGSYYLVLGDTYAGSGGAGGDYNIGGLREGQPRYKQHHYRDAVTKPKQKLLIPYRVAIGLQEDGWICRNDITWRKPNAMPSSVKDRLTCTTERIFHFVKNAKGYFYDLDAIREPHSEASIKNRQYPSQIKFTPTPKHDERLRTQGSLSQHGVGSKSLRMGHPAGKNPGDAVELTKHDIAVNRVGNFAYADPLHEKEYHPSGKNPGDYWSINTQPFPQAHFAVFPESLIEPIIKSSCPPDGVVLDPFCGSGTTNLVAMNLGRASIGIDINADYIKMAEKRCRVDTPSLQDFGVGDE